MTWTSPADKPYRKLGLDEASATFEVENVGGVPVHITDVETSCGCAMPEIEPRTIAAGGVGVVKVKATPLDTGEKTVSLTLNTDSPASPQVVLRLHIVGSRQPPYMTQAGGDLGYISDFSEPEVREIFAFTLESADADPTPPAATSDLPNLSNLCSDFT